MCRYNGHVAFDKQGNMQECVTWKMNFVANSSKVQELYKDDYNVQKVMSGDITLKPNFTFKDQLVVTHVNKNRLYLQSVNTNRKYSAFITDIPKFFPLAHDGVIEGYFTFRKNGERIGLVPVSFDYEDHTIKK